MKCLIVFLLVSSVLLAFCTKRAEAAPKTKEEIDRIMADIDIHWEGDRLHAAIGDSVDCFELCPGRTVDVCKVGIMMLTCYDTNRDAKISIDEMDVGLHKLNAIERWAAGDARHWIQKFDGGEGKADGKISVREFMSVEQNMCGDLKNCLDYFFRQCKTDKHL